MEKELIKNYNELINEMTPEYGESHGVFTLHEGKNAESLNPKIMLLGRENRGHGNKLDDSKGFKVAKNDLGWLKDKYKFTKSPFWRCIGKSLHRKFKFKYDAEIFENLYWTNLYKVSPAKKSVGANTLRSKKRQKSICKEILKNEIFMVKPNFIIAFTGEWINAFKDSFSNVSIKQDNYAFKTYNCKLGNHKFKLITLPHPQGKKEEPIIKFICKNLN